MLAVHEKRRDFKCEFCEYSAGTKGVLKTHVKNKHLRLEADIQDCEHCPYRALKRADLRDHMRDAHGTR